MPRDRHGQWFERIGEAGWDVLPNNGVPNRRDAERLAFRARQNLAEQERQRAVVEAEALRRRERTTFRMRVAELNHAMGPEDALHWEWIYDPLIHNIRMRERPQQAPAPQAPQAGPGMVLDGVGDWNRWGHVDFEAPANPNPEAVMANGLEQLVRNVGLGRLRPREEVNPRANRNPEYLKKYKPLDMKSMGKGPIYDRGVTLQPFKVDYDSLEQVDQKLMHSVILIEGWPFWVAGTFCVDQQFGLLVTPDADEMKYNWIMLQDVTDFRTAAPGYITGGQNRTYWMYRTPERQNRQGMDQRNTFLKAAGSNMDAQQGAQTQTLLKGLVQRRNVLFQSNIAELFDAGVFDSLRLSNNLAVHRVKNKGTNLGVEYIGRPLGLIIGGRCKVFDEEDLQPSWIIKDCSEVNLELVA